MYELSFQIFIFIHIRRPPFRLSRSTSLPLSLSLSFCSHFYDFIIGSWTFLFFPCPVAMPISIQTIKCNEQARKQLIQPTSLHHRTTEPLSHPATQTHSQALPNHPTTQSNPTNPTTRLLFEIISHCSSQIDLELFVHRQAAAGIHNEVNRAWLSATKVCQP